MPADERLPNSNQGVLAMSSIGQLGRFGNQIFQYAFLRICARASGLSVETSPWIGQALFGLNDPPLSHDLPFLVEQGSRLEALLDVAPEVMAALTKARGERPGRIRAEAMVNGVAPADLVGVFQWHSSHYRPHKEYFRSLFRPMDDLLPWLEEPLTLMRSRGKTVIAIHLRTGDYRWLPQFSWTLVVPPQRWAAWLESVWDQFDDPVLFLCGNDVRPLRRWFRRFEPVTPEDLQLQPPPRLNGHGVDFYRDYYVLSQADVVGVSNSSFSFSAAMLNERAMKFVRPRWDAQSPFMEFDPWDADPLLFDTNDRLAMSYARMLRSAYQFSGWPAIITTAFLYHPGGLGIVFGLRLQIIYREWGWKGVRNFLLRHPLNT